MNNYAGGINNVKGAVRLLGRVCNSEAEVEGRCLYLSRRASMILNESENRQKLDKLARAINERGVLSGDEVKGLVG
jgi:hypothetical protein